MAPAGRPRTLPKPGQTLLSMPLFSLRIRTDAHRQGPHGQLIKDHINDPSNCAKKLIEVALPLDAINKAAAREKSIRHGHPSTLHLWWARRPLAAARVVIFAQMVDDPAEFVTNKRTKN